MRSADVCKQGQIPCETDLCEPLLKSNTNQCHCKDLSDHSTQIDHCENDTQIIDPVEPLDSCCCDSVQSNLTDQCPVDSLPVKPLESLDSKSCGSDISVTDQCPTDILPLEPEKPLDSDCCGSGCVPCVFDIYEQEVKIWERECERIRRKISGEDKQSTGPLLEPDEYRSFTIESVYEETTDTKRFHVQLPQGRSLGLQIGQHIIIRGQYRGKTITRQYTPVSHVETKGYFDLLIKIYKDGQMSQSVKLWTVGTKIDVRGPYGEFVYTPNKHRRICMLAAGTGIAPMSQVIQGILNNDDDDTVIKLYYACKTYGDILMKSQLQEWSKYWNLSVTYVLSQAQEGHSSSYSYGDVIHRGRIDKGFLSAEWSEAPYTADDIILICGTQSFDVDMRKHCVNLGIREDRIFKF